MKLTAIIKDTTDNTFVVASTDDKCKIIALACYVPSADLARKRAFEYSDAYGSVKIMPNAEMPDACRLMAVGHILSSRA